ncbi:MAG: M20/M25/M40 family metallo-hydrolase [Pseudomonadales bacterium]|jgi:Zn-dependent M28 family amino/carboxypeptidase|nr:M20/M25/M40 family metallo-hydrolase [Pseudomonadales bacterium]
MKPLRPTLAICLLAALPAWSASLIPDDVRAEAAGLRDRALEANTAYAIVESLTTEVGPRLAGTDAEARARDWSVAKLEALGFENVRVEPFDMPTWVRGDERARIVSPYPQPLRATALGNSGSTGPEGLTAEIAYFETLEAMEAMPEGSLTGKVAFVDHAMGKTQDGSSYSYFGRARFQGPRLAAERGAVAILIRSVGTHSHRFPHTGGTSFGDVDPIPAAAVSPPDADQIRRIVERGQPLRVALTLTPEQLGPRESGNVIAEIPGAERPEEIVITGGHLDSWDLGTGAIDDGAGVAITTAAAKLILDSGLRPARTIRVVHWGAEEVGLLGARAYAQAHAAEIGLHVGGSESDFGAERIYALATGELSEQGAALTRELAAILAPLGIALDAGSGGSGGPDLSPLNARGMPVLRLAQDGRDYFDLHHTPDDTLDKIDPQAMTQNVAAYAAFLWVLANTDVDLRSAAQE